MISILFLDQSRIIVEKRPGGNVKVTDMNLNPVDESRIDFSVIGKELTNLNRFYK